MLSLIFMYSEVLLGKTVVQLDAKSEEKEREKKVHLHIPGLPRLIL